MVLPTVRSKVQRTQTSDVREGGGGVILQPSATWNAKEQRLALFLASGRGIKAAAEEVRIGERTAHKWLEDPEYRAFVAALRGRLLEEAVGRLADAAGKAVQTLCDLLDDPKSHVRLRAALGVLDTLLKVREHVEFEGRIARLEGMADAAGAARPGPEA
jgi:hypothetical protein